MTIQCETCGRPTEQQVLAPDGNLWHILCPNCADQLNSCGFCKNAGKCDFETNPSSLPKYIQKQIRQGPIISVMTVKNPERIRQTCQNGCPCYDSEFECMREFYYCERIDHIYEDNFERADSGATEDSGDGPEVHSEIHE